MRLVHLGAEAEVLGLAGDLALRLVRGLHHALPHGHRHRRRDGRPADAGRSSARSPLPDARGKQFNRSFLGSVRRHGRVFEVGMMAAYKLRTGDLLRRRRTRSRRCWPRESSRCCPSAAAAPSEVREVFRRAEEEERNREVRLLSRLQPRIDRVGLRPLDAGGLPRAGHRAGGDSRLGLLRLDAGPRQQRLAGRGAAGAQSAEGAGRGTAR